MKKIIIPVALILSAMVFTNCNDSGTGNTQKDTTTNNTDTIVTPIVTQGGLIDSLQTGATDTTMRKDSTKK